jgi:heat shock protein HslJ
MKSRVVTVCVLAGVLALALSGCDGAGSAAGDPLEGTSWVLVAYRKSRPISGTTITATFEEGRVHGSSGCNSYSGSYRVRGDTIAVSDLAWTEMACLEPEGVMEQETLVMSYLSDAETFRFVDGQLQLFRADGEALTFEPQG